jgi:DNA adenine methylase
VSGAARNHGFARPQRQLVHERLAGTLFYLDPPYFGTEDYYGKALLDRAQYKVMAERLARLKGHFILSLNDVPEIRETFSAFDIEDAALTYTAGGNGNSKAVNELIIYGGG